MAFKKRTVHIRPPYSEEYFLSPASFCIKLYDTRKKMHKAIDRIKRNEDSKNPNGSTPDERGRFMGYRRVFYENGNEFESDMLGEIYLNREDVTTEVIAHECCHAAIEYFQRVKEEIPAFDIWIRDETPFCSEENELFCYLLGRFTSVTMAWVNLWENS